MLDDKDRNWLSLRPLESLGIDEKDYLKSIVKQALVNLHHLTLENLRDWGKGEHEGEESLLREKKRNQIKAFLALGLLGEIDIIPSLLTDLDEVITYFAARTRFEIEIVLKHLVGQISPGKDRFRICLQRWHQNRLAYEMLPLETRLNLEDLESWRELLVEAKNKGGDYIERLLQHNSQLNLLWDGLESWTPYLILSPLWDFPIFNQKTSLHQWLVDLSDDPVRGLFGESSGAFQVPEKLQNVKIWRDSSINMSGVSKIGGFYWEYLYTLLNMWRLLNKADLRSVQWDIDSENIKIAISWYIPMIRSIESLHTESRESALSLIIFRDNHSEYLTGISNALLLNAQLLAERGGNKLFFDLDSNRLVVGLQIVRADARANISPVRTLPLDGIQLLVSYITKVVFPRYLKASQQLETELLEIIKQMESKFPSFSVPENAITIPDSEPHFDNIEYEGFYKLLLVKYEVIWLRETMTKHLESWK